ncbi:SAC3 family protein B isoform X2 [Tripterygium wilfordii]|nr:SAC3 family protein B isoform X2 [Tripterygium wilfordii]
MPKSFVDDYDAQTQAVPSAKTSFVASRNLGTGVTAKVARFTDLKRTRSPPLHYSDEEIPKYSSTSALQSHLDSTVDSSGYFVPPGRRSPGLEFGNNPSTNSFRPSFGEDRRPYKSPPSLGTRPNAFSNIADPRIPQRSLPSASAMIAEAAATRPTSSPIPKRERSPADEVIWGNHLSPANDMIAEVATRRSTSSPIPKRARSPPINSTDEFSLGNPHMAEDGTEREMQAKARRLARFKIELSEPTQDSSDIAGMKVSSNKLEHSSGGRQKLVGEHSIESACDVPNRNTSSDYDSLETSSVIIGLCPDMCPDSERAERERKGDLDQYERLDGDRNQTSMLLAVKKYTRTAEREANLIRPMPILQKTIDYLLSLLDQPYDDRFLAIYNFLWDRMRAIRMDLRMQHIFNQEAITMLEQMIRLHIIAMHELCEYTKGEGFSEGFDAHLNIEQMNKTSVELFQMYDDHRKKGINVPTEKEFRGYYALLKLDKHPGYRVEPAELSLDLAKMTPEIRQTSEVRFARDVARACRTGNFIAFFRLAREASYLQACLMHAHFSKLRTQALASLYCGLQYNQGLPVPLVAKWLGMEEEDIESLLDYHGFVIKEFEEPYLVKEGPFLHGDKDFPIKCSVLVNLKRSKTIVGDVSPIVEDDLPSTQMTSSSSPVFGKNHLGEIYKHDKKSLPSVFVENKSPTHAIDEDMPSAEAIVSPKFGSQLKTINKALMVEGDHMAASAQASPLHSPSVYHSLESQPAKVVDKATHGAPFTISTENNIFSSVDGMPLQNVSRSIIQERSPSGKYDYAMANSLAVIPMQNVPKTAEQESSISNHDFAGGNSEPENLFFNKLEDRASDVYQENSCISHKLEGEVPLDSEVESGNGEVTVECHNEEVAQAKYKLILRLWRRWALRRRILREQRKSAANAALGSLSLGPLLWHNKDQASKVGKVDIDNVMRERHENRSQSWSKLNVSDLVADKLSRRNPEAKCLCWKIILCSQEDKLGQKNQVAHLAPHSWLFSKLMPCGEVGGNNELAFSSRGLSIWKKWIPSQSGTDLTCCLSVIKDAALGNLNETVSGASAVMFLVSESIPWRSQKIQLHNILMSIPFGSSIPLLILCGSYSDEVSDLSTIIVNELGLHDIDKSKISNFLVNFLVSNQKMQSSDEFFSDERLREGLLWLASESPLQPVLRCVKMRELVLTHLNSSLEVLDRMGVSEVGPNHCISAFNEALDQSLQEIDIAAKSNPTGWPCPDIALLPDNSDEHIMVSWYLPEVRWNSQAKIEPLLYAVRNCKLPTFPDKISCLSKGSNVRQEIDNQKSLLEDCLISYLSQSSEMMGFPLASKEAHVMLQKSVLLELHNSSYYIVPMWVMIFRRIFNWRLISLSNGLFSSAYVLEHCFVTPTAENIYKSRLETSLSRPSLDEMIEVGCSFSLMLEKGGGQSHPEVTHSWSAVVSNGELQQVITTSDTREAERNEETGALASMDNFAPLVSEFDNSSTKSVVESQVSKAADKLSRLLEYCKIRQNSNSDMLSIYF